MLRGINPLLHSDLLGAMRAMGHNDRIAVVDGNYPATSRSSRLLRLDGVGSAEALGAILEHLPVDGGEDAALTMAATGVDPPAIRELIACLETYGVISRSVEPEVFYQETEDCFVVVQTGERRAYGNVIIRKGYIVTE